MQLVANLDKGTQERDWISGILMREKNVGSSEKRICLVIGKSVAGIAMGKVQGRTFNNLTPVNILFGLQNKLPRPVASVKAAGHECRKEEVVIGPREIGGRDEGLEMLNTEWLFTTNRVSTDLH
jgi:hypothetical protein